MKLDITKTQLRNLIDNIDISTLSESENVDERDVAVTLQKMYNQINESLNHHQTSINVIPKPHSCNKYFLNPSQMCDKCIKKFYPYTYHLYT